MIAGPTPIFAMSVKKEVNTVTTATIPKSSGESIRARIAPYNSWMKIFEYFPMKVIVTAFLNETGEFFFSIQSPQRLSKLSLSFEEEYWKSKIIPLTTYLQYL